MKLFSGFFLALLFVGCQSNDQSVVESPSDPLINAQNDSSEVEKTVEEVEQNDLKDLKECIEFATFKSPLNCVRMGSLFTSASVTRATHGSFLITNCPFLDPGI